MTVNSITEWNTVLKRVTYLNAILIFLDSIISFYAINFLNCEEMNELTLFFMDVFGVNLGLVVIDVFLFFALYGCYRISLKFIKEYPSPWLYLLFLVGMSLPASRRFWVIYENLLEIRPLL